VPEISQLGSQDDLSGRGQSRASTDGAELRGLIFDIQRYCTHDGPGIRTTVFFKGCPLSCPWCHNPESISGETEVMVFEDRCIGCEACLQVCPGKLGLVDECTCCSSCVDVCPTQARRMVGRAVTVPELVKELARDTVFYDDSGGGVTFSGGEPLFQPDFLIATLEVCQQRELHTAVDTSGFAPASVIQEVARLTDLFLFDLKLVDPSRHLQAIGVSNEPILANLEALSKCSTPVWLRVPVIPGWTADNENMQAILELVSATPSLQRVCLLPYHRTALPKLARMGCDSQLTHVIPPSQDEIEALAKRFESAGVDVTIGG
jgi:pyruvate formate lyase activating enzyme